MYRVTYSGHPTGEVNNRFVLFGSIVNTPTWEDLSKDPVDNDWTEFFIPVDWEWCGTKDFDRPLDAIAYAEKACNGEYFNTDYDQWIWIGNEADQPPH